VNKRQNAAIKALVDRGWIIGKIITHRMRVGDYLHIGEISIDFRLISKNLPKGVIFPVLRLRSDGTISGGNYKMVAAALELGLKTEPTKSLGRGLMGRRRS
jgi:hypothetical protein